MLYARVPDSHTHLFFECTYSKQVWYNLRLFVNMPNISEKWIDIINYLSPRAKHNSSWSVVARLLLGSMVYFVWQERNIIIFKKGRRSIDCLVGLIFKEVRLKLMSLSFKNSSRSAHVLKIRRIDSKAIDDDLV